MGKRGLRKTPLEVLKKRGSKQVFGRVEKFISLAQHPEELAETAPVAGAPSPEQVLPVLAAAVKSQGIGRKEHNLLLWHLAKMISDMEFSRLRWLAYSSAQPVEALVPEGVRIERSLHQNYISMSAEAVRLARDFGLTPSSMADIPARAAVRVVGSQASIKSQPSNLEATL
jgi:hypothetical protein